MQFLFKLGCKIFQRAILVPQHNVPILFGYFSSFLTKQKVICKFTKDDKVYKQSEENFLLTSTAQGSVFSSRILSTRESTVSLVIVFIQKQRHDEMQCINANLTNG